MENDGFLSLEFENSSIFRKGCNNKLIYTSNPMEESDLKKKKSYVKKTKSLFAGEISGKKKNHLKQLV